MDKIVKIVNTLSETEFEELLKNVSTKSNDKISSLLNLARTQVMDDKVAMERLNVKGNAFFTLKSRLNQKIETFLVSRIGTPKMDLVKKVISFSDYMMQVSREVAIMSLKKLEKECIDYDLPFELVKIYQYFKKLMIFKPESYYNYSLLYNKSVAYALSLDKGEDYISTYFKTYSDYFLSRNTIELDKLSLIRKELETLSKSYDSHRLFVLSNIVNVFHIIFIEDKSYNKEMSDVGEMLSEIDNVFYQFPQDTQYKHFQLVLKHLQFEYNFKLGLNRKADVYFQELNHNLTHFLDNFNSYTFPSQALYTKMMLFKANNQLGKLTEEDEAIFIDYVPNPQLYASYIAYVIYRGASYMHSGKYTQAMELFNEARNNISFKYFDHAEMEIKLMMATVYALQGEKDLCNHLIKSNQRIIRNNSELGYESARYYMKILTKLILHPDTDDQKLLNYYNNFQSLNNGKDQVLAYLDTYSILFKIDRKQ